MNFFEKRTITIIFFFKIFINLRDRNKINILKE